MRINKSLVEIYTKWLEKQSKEKNKLIDEFVKDLKIILSDVKDDLDDLVQDFKL